MCKYHLFLPAVPKFRKELFERNGDLRAGRTLRVPINQPLPGGDDLSDLIQVFQDSTVFVKEIQFYESLPNSREPLEQLSKQTQGL